MAGLVPAIHALLNLPMRNGFVYIVSNRKHGVLYVGVTNDLKQGVDGRDKPGHDGVRDE